MRPIVNPYLDVFPQCLREYMEQIKAAVRRGSHHDQRRHLFLDFLRKGFGLEPTEVELEEKVKAAEVRGRIDALFKSVIFEFKTDLKAELLAAELELKKYFKSRRRPSDYIALVTDGIAFVAYQFEKDNPQKITQFSLDEGDELASFRMLDQFIFTTRPTSPRSADITNRFGLHSAVFNKCREMLHEMFESVRQKKSVNVKFREWNALLARVYGSRIGDTTLFLKHTYLTMLSRLLVAKALAPDADRKPRDYVGLLTGEFFKNQNLLNLAEPDFFSWALETPVKKDFLGFLAKLESYLKIYDLSEISEDILKEVYQELVDPESRHALGEYYTPDWLADLTLEAISYENGRILDPACGSGSFLLAAIRRKREHGLKGQKLLKYAQQWVIGIDVHPVAVLMAKANLILGLTKEIRKNQEDINLPIYMADTLQVSEDSKGEKIEVPVSEDESFFIPLETVKRQGELDPLVDAITEKACFASKSKKKMESARLSLQKNDLAGMSDQEKFFWMQNFKLMVKLIARGEDTVFGYILKNAYRPAFIRQVKVDYVVGNPPWLSYRYVEDKGYKTRIKELTFALELLGPKEFKLFTQMDTSTLFFLHCEKEFLKPGGTIAFVLPKTTILPSKQHAGFQAHGVSEIHDFTEVQPLFNVRSVMIVRHTRAVMTADIPTLFYSAKLPMKNLTWKAAEGHFEIEDGTFSFLDTKVQSKHYYQKFFQGATLVPRCLWFIQPQKGAAKNVKAPYLETGDEAYDEAKPQWRVRLSGRIEREYLFETVLAKGLLPFCVLRRELVFLPVRLLRDGPVMADSSSLLQVGGTNAAKWMQEAEDKWERGRETKEQIPLHGWLNYTQKIVKQNAKPRFVVLYNTSGTNITAALLKPSKTHSFGFPVSGFLADAKTYYYYPNIKAEGSYLVAMLNSDIVNDLIKVYQPQGLYGERDIHRRPFEACAIPPFNKSDARHRELVRLAVESSKVIRKYGSSLKGRLGQRRLAAKQLISEEMQQINKLVEEILKEAGQTAAQPARRKKTNPNRDLFEPPKNGLS